MVPFSVLQVMRMTNSQDRFDRIHQRIGEIAVCFQSMESRIREIGWLLLDPHRCSWPPTLLRNLTTYSLLEDVNRAYRGRVATFPGAGAREYCDSFSFTIERAHDARRARNGLLHSAFIELKAGGEISEIMRVNNRLVLDEDGEHTVESEMLTEEALTSQLGQLALVSLGLGLHYTQLVHWAPFDPPPQLEGCGLPFHRTGLPYAAEVSGDPPSSVDT